MILTVANQKGGTGKTTTAAAIAQAAAYRGFKVLAIDLDPQGNLSFTLGADMGHNTGNAYNLIMGNEPIKIRPQTVAGVEIIPAAWDLSTITSGKGTARRLQRALEPIKNNYDFIIIDTPPTPGELQYNGLQAADGLIIPLQSNIYDLQGLYQIADTGGQIMQSNPALSFTGLIVTQHSGRSTLKKQMLETIKATAAGLNIPYLGEVRQAVALQEAQATQSNLYEYAPKSNPAKDYLRIFDRIAEQAGAKR